MTFPLGQLLATPGALEVLRVNAQTPIEFLRRHATGDWGDVDEHDQQANEVSLRDGSRIFSAYHTKDGAKLYVITEAVGDDGKRSATTILLPGEY